MSRLNKTKTAYNFVKIHHHTTQQLPLRLSKRTNLYNQYNFKKK